MASDFAVPVGDSAGLLLSYQYTERLHFGGFHGAIAHVSHYGTGVDSQAAHSEYQSSLLVVRAARVPLRAPKSMDFGTGSTSEAF